MEGPGPGWAQCSVRCTGSTSQLFEDIAALLDKRNSRDVLYLEFQNTLGIVIDQRGMVQAESRNRRQKEGKRFGIYWGKKKERKKEKGRKKENTLQPTAQGCWTKNSKEGISVAVSAQSSAFGESLLKEGRCAARDVEHHHKTGVRHSHCTSVPIAMKQ